MGLFFCQKKRDPSVATLCQDDIVRVRRFLKTKRIKNFTIYEEDLCITSHDRGKC